MRPWKTLTAALLIAVATAGAGWSTSKEAHPETQTMLGQIDRAQHIPQVMAQGPSADAERQAVLVPLPPARPSELTVAQATLGCANCSQRIADLRYGRCDSKNDYLESEIDRLSGKSDLFAELLKNGPRGDSVIKPVCVKAGLETRFGPSAPAFRQCGGTAASRRVARPCVSEKYVALVNNSFDLVGRCLAPMLSPSVAQQKDDLRTIFGVLNWESGLHVNAVSPTGAAGIGQMTSDTIRSVSRNELGDVREQLVKQGGQCAKLSNELLRDAEPMNHAYSRSCERISVTKGNPLLNIVYSFASMIQNKEQLGSDIFSSRQFGPRFALSPDAREKLKIVLTAWSHNTGLGGLKTPLAALLNSQYRRHQVTDPDLFLKQLATAMRNYPHRANRGRGRRTETSGYWPHIEKTLAQLERDAGGGSCVAR